MKNNFLKILIVSLIFFGTLGVSKAEASFSCYVDTSPRTASDVVVLELTSESNSHAALPGLSGYTTAVYCGGVTGISNSCSGNSEIFAKLSGTTNAHIQERSGTETVYPNDVCISNSSSNAEIEVGYQDDDCSGFDTTIVSLTKSPSNAHAGKSDSYTRKICASMSIPQRSGGGGGGGGYLPPTVTTVTSVTNMIANPVSNIKGAISNVTESAVSAVKTAAKKLTANKFSNKESFSRGNESASASEDLASTIDLGELAFANNSSENNIDQNENVGVFAKIDPRTLSATALFGDNPLFNNIFTIGGVILSALVLVYAGRRIFG
ncbi:MAG: hypothetical protein US50_C0033G0002 [Candidatus Nomurabacteria bacterium GW2011_GWB1_37_5]|uniref:Uncharacterized protein n=1 Tax=Candidatus Nomurabacteria bacterium GW2011_GWB1_37_5 TaxID=1618742 RepID=A0A0G0GXW0_9BACT|nr:MAG: hypothetical protein US50_C0033G0002 [Candidatus Nomurabacteria bacterium GW2011_GWB1_37_5]